MKQRKYEARINSVQFTKKVTHYRGMPAEVREGSEDLQSFPDRQEMAEAARLLIEETDDGVFLYRFSLDGDPVGDTWHASIEDAMHQAKYEFGDALSPWREQEKSEE
jgi:hypothetical protein